MRYTNGRRLPYSLTIIAALAMAAVCFIGQIPADLVNEGTTKATGFVWALDAVLPALVIAVSHEAMRHEKDSTIVVDYKFHVALWVGLFGVATVGGVFAVIHQAYAIWGIGIMLGISFLVWAMHRPVHC